MTRLEAIDKRIEAATKGPWEKGERGGGPWVEAKQLSFLQGNFCPVLRKRNSRSNHPRTPRHEHRWA
jgi:hypothetical protein